MTPLTQFLQYPPPMNHFHNVVGNKEANCKIKCYTMHCVLITTIGIRRNATHSDESSKIYKERVKAYHDKKLLKRDLKPGQQVLLLNLRLKLFIGKLKSKWSRPFVIKNVRPYDAIELHDPQSQDPDSTWVVNGQRLKLYHGGEFEKANTILHFITH